MPTKRKLHDHNGETLLYVYWSHLPAGSNGPEHHVRRGEVGSDLSLERSPEFTSEEMSTIMFHARKGVREVLLARKRANRG
jgi:hypothetical protein